MAVNKVTLGDETLIDLTNDTAEADDVAEGAYFHTAAGVRTAGTRRNIVVDDELSPTSENPVQNKVIYEALQNINIDVDDELSASSENPVQNKVVTAALSQKAGILRDTASGSIASFVPDSTVPDLLGVTVNVEPVQDLHGFDSPWPAGGGKNKYPVLIGDDSFANNAGATHSSDNGVLVVNCGTGYVSGVLSNSDSQIRPLPGNYTEAITYSFSIKASANNVQVFVGYDALGATTVTATTTWQRVTITSTATGQSRSFNVYNRSENEVTVEVKDFQFELGSTATSYAPYANICPISGLDAVEVETSGANIWDEQWVTGSIGTDGADIASSNGIRSANYCRCAGDTEYSFVKPAGITARVYWYGKTKNYISRSVAQREGSQEVITSPVNAYWYRIQVGDASYRYPTYNNDVSLNLPATKTEYLPHVGTTYTVTLGRTVYGGTLDVVNGTLTITHAHRKLSEFSGWTHSSYGYFGTTDSVQASQFFVSACDTYSIADWTIPAAQRPDNSINTGASGQAQRKLYVKDSSYETVEDFLSARGNVEIVYTRVTPLTIQLDPVAIATIANQTNNVWADAGDVSVEYAADLKHYIDSKIAALIAQIVNS